MTNELIAIEQNQMMPLMDIQMATERFSQVAEFVKQIMKQDIDFGVIPGTNKPTLLKPGAEKLTTFFGLSKQFDIIERTEDFIGKDHHGEPFFYYLYRCNLYRGNVLIASADGSCNSFETKYRWRKAERTCPNCGEANIRKSKNGGWYCWIKTGGCGANFPDGDINIERQDTGRVLNPDVCDQVNTFQKMAQKRALVAATLLAVNASEFFTQDVEDYITIDIYPQEVKSPDPEPPAPQSKQPPKPKASNGKTKASARNHIDDLFDEVQARTDNYYNHKGHLFQVLKEWPMPGDEEAIKAAIVKGVQHVSNKVDEKSAQKG